MKKNQSIKKSIFLSLLALSLILCIGLVSAQEYTYISESNILTASLVNQDPDPAIAGNIVELRIGVENWGSSPAQGYDVELVFKYPFEPLPGEQYVQSTGNLQGFQTTDDQKILKFRLRTNRETGEGTYPMDILIYKSGQKDVSAIKKTLAVDVKNRESAEVIYIDKVKLIPGKQTPVEFTINNVGAAPLRDMSFSWENEDDIVLPVGSSDTKYVKFLGIGEKITLTYDVIADTKADAGLYKLKLSLLYDDPITGIQKEVSNNAGIYVGGITDFEVAFSETSAGETSFSIANIGSNPASSVSVIIPEQTGWTAAGSNSMIIGNLNKGDYTVASFTLQETIDKSERTDSKTRPTTTTSRIIKINIAYTDTMGERLVVSKDVKMGSPTNTTSMFGRNGKTNSGSLTDSIKNNAIYIVIVLLLIAAYFGYKKYKGKPKKKKQ